MTHKISSVAGLFRYLFSDSTDERPACGAEPDGHSGGQSGAASIYQAADTPANRDAFAHEQANKKPVRSHHWLEPEQDSIHAALMKKQELDEDTSTLERSQYLKDTIKEAIKKGKVFEYGSMEWAVGTLSAHRMMLLARTVRQDVMPINGDVMIAMERGQEGVSDARKLADALVIKNFLRYYFHKRFKTSREPTITIMYDREQGHYLVAMTLPDSEGSYDTWTMDGKIELTNLVVMVDTNKFKPVSSFESLLAIAHEDKRKPSTKGTINVKVHKQHL